MLPGTDGIQHAHAVDAEGLRRVQCIGGVLKHHTILPRAAVGVKQHPINRRLAFFDFQVVGRKAPVNQPLKPEFLCHNVHKHACAGRQHHRAHILAPQLLQVVFRVGPHEDKLPVLLLHQQIAPLDEILLRAGQAITADQVRRAFVKPQPPDLPLVLIRHLITKLKQRVGRNAAPLIHGVHQCSVHIENRNFLQARILAFAFSR